MQRLSSKVMAPRSTSPQGPLFPACARPTELQKLRFCVFQGLSIMAFLSSPPWRLREGTWYFSCSGGRLNNDGRRMWGGRWANGGPFFSRWLTPLFHQRIIVKKKLSLPKRRDLRILGRIVSIYRPLFIYSKWRLGIEMHRIRWVLEETGIKEVEVLW